MLNEDYSLADRVLHRLSLGSRALSELSFDLDQRSVLAAQNSIEIANRPHVFVTGLARAGTTILMRAIHESGEFRSLTYRDMPFPLAPNLWKKLSGQRKPAPAARERAHGDRILTNVDSPEAIDEVFWRVHTGSKYVRRNGLVPYRPDKEAMALFSRYIVAVIESGEPGQWRYLSKNNNNILRLPALVEYFPRAKFVIPFRAPADHATSLWRQHERFCEMQRRRPFVRSYMGWLVHHEFGLDHRPFQIDKPATRLSPAERDYWLDTWIRVHEWLVRCENPRCIFVSYDDLCRNPRVWASLSASLGLARRNLDPDFSPSAAAASDEFDPALLARAMALHDELRNRCSYA